MSPRRRELLRLGRRGRLVRVVEGVNRGERVLIVLFRKPGGARGARFFGLRQRSEAIAFAEGIADEQSKPPAPASPVRLTVEQLWAAYFADVRPSLRPRSQVLYPYFWKLFAAFAGPHTPAEDLTVRTMTELREELEKQGKAVNTIRRVMGVARMAFRWAEIHELIQKNRVGRYVYRVAKEARPESPDEFRDDEFRLLLASFKPTLQSQWRPWVALTLCGNQGARQNAVLHLRWEDVDLEAGVITWRAAFDKTGREWQQPLRAASRAALEVAAGWRDRAGDRGGWVLPGYGRKDAGAPYTIQALWGALKRAEERAGIAHRERRGAHGLRRLLAGEVARLTGDPKLAMDAIGDRDIKQAERYVKVRMDRLAGAFERLDTESASQVQASENGGA